MLRWREEIELLVEEMRRVCAFDRWKADWWDARAAGAPVVCDEVREGLKAIALGSSDRLREQATRLEAAWSPLVEIALKMLKEIPTDSSATINYTLPTSRYDDEPDEDDTISDENTISSSA